MTFAEELDGLRKDGSWRYTWSEGFLDEATFRLEPQGRPSRGALVERLVAGGVPDPAQWEAVLIEALLTHPAAARLRTLRLHLTDYHHSARRAAVALAARPRDRLTELYFGYDFKHLYERGPTSDGGWIEPMDHYDTGLVGDESAAMWSALPALRSLTVEGALFFHWIAGPALTHLRLRGAVISDGAVFPGSTADFLTLPGLETLEMDLGPDIHGVECSVDQLDELTAGGYPALRTLDLGRAGFYDGDLAALRALAGSSILPQLERLRIRSLEVQRFEVEGEPLAALTELAPAFAHLRLSVAGPIAVEGADRPAVDRVLPTAPWTD